jgi:hypothetical protein
MTYAIKVNCAVNKRFAVSNVLKCSANGIESFYFEIMLLQLNSQMFIC